MHIFCYLWYLFPRRLAVSSVAPRAGPADTLRYCTLDPQSSWATGPWTPSRAGLQGTTANPGPTVKPCFRTSVVTHRHPLCVLSLNDTKLTLGSVALLGRTRPPSQAGLLVGQSRSPSQAGLLVTDWTHGQPGPPVELGFWLTVLQSGWSHGDPCYSRNRDRPTAVPRPHNRPLHHKGAGALPALSGFCYTIPFFLIFSLTRI